MNYEVEVMVSRINPQNGKRYDFRPQRSGLYRFVLLPLGEKARGTKASGDRGPHRAAASASRSHGNMS
jgi:hypothetical protein